MPRDVLIHVGRFALRFGRHLSIAVGPIRREFGNLGLLFVVGVYRHPLPTVDKSSSFGAFAFRIVIRFFIVEAERVAVRELIHRGRIGLMSALAESLLPVDRVGFVFVVIPRPIEPSGRRFRGVQDTDRATLFSKSAARANHMQREPRNYASVMPFCALTAQSPEGPH